MVALKCPTCILDCGWYSLFATGLMPSPPLSAAKSLEVNCVPFYVITVHGILKLAIQCYMYKLAISVAVVFEVGIASVSLL